jgi:hypothetical protein
VRIQITRDVRCSQANARLVACCADTFLGGAAKGVLDHGEEAARLFVVIVSVDGGFLDQLVEVRCMATARSAIVRFFMNCLVRNLLTKIKLQIETR